MSYGESVANQAIIAGTYPEAVDSALNLYSRLATGITLYDEGVSLGRTALDVGSRDGVYLSVIRALGPQEVTVVEPEAYDVRQALNAGVMDTDRDGIYIGTIQEWVNAGYDPVDSVFALNIFRRFARDANFIGALAAALRSGGFLVVSFEDERLGDQFARTVQSHPEFGLRGLQPSLEKWAAAGGSQRFGAYRPLIALWRREEAS